MAKVIHNTDRLQASGIEKRGGGVVCPLEFKYGPMVNRNRLQLSVPPPGTYLLTVFRVCTTHFRFLEVMMSSEFDLVNAEDWELVWFTEARLHLTLTCS